MFLKIPITRISYTEVIYCCMSRVTFPNDRIRNKSNFKLCAAGVS